ncbi:hypothetical protein PTSG_08427 [Salpingoeca rosetta]|uniref:Coiled-coil domain-containing protein n=1 Tax=Salpingoeca rosetta (strain ATCC 50818 / BSB-021) TaxID=946362 RepID=F2UJN4_SALR5|nr:uncharacterized protein PTSG_08427 [Salpingoeca rosetta]EGD77333.1 hypothetical protein PTSG_08427 [Salpingoeca rosetta]|eukprot:XP_004990677.1 hypothetical protein PTSG_08427 [Salpingoeca rosetta]
MSSQRRGGGGFDSLASANAADVFVKRLKGGLPGRGFQRMDYSAVRSKIKENRKVGARAAAKIHGIKKQKESVEASRRDEFHRQVWAAELSRLNALSSQAQSEFQEFLDNLAEESRSEDLLRLILHHNDNCQDSERQAAAVRLKFHDAQAAVRRVYRRHRQGNSSAPTTQFGRTPHAQQQQRSRNGHRRHTAATARFGRSPSQRQHQHQHAWEMEPDDPDTALIVGTREEFAETLAVLSEQESTLLADLVQLGCVEGCRFTVPAAFQATRVDGDEDADGDGDADDHGDDDGGDVTCMREFAAFARMWREDLSTILDACNFPDLKVHLTQLFNESLQHCRDRVVDLHDAYVDVIMNPFGGWEANDHYTFEVILNAYTSLKLPSQFQFQGLSARQMAFEVLAKALPGKKRQALTDHEDFVAACTFFAKMQREVRHANTREMGACLDDIRALLAEELQREEERKQTLAEQARHQEMQLERMQRLLELRRLRLERVEQEMKQQRELEAQARAVQRKEEQREHRYRERIARAVKAFKEDKAHLEALAKEQEEGRLQQIQELKRQQAVENAERVSFRHGQYEEKLEEREARKEEESRVARDREARLEALRKQVRPTNLPDDPGRLLRPTKAMDAARKEAKRDREIRSMLPNMDVIGYDDKRITADPRFKLAQALNKAGLGKSEYARQAMLSMPGAVQPRRDAQSTLFRPDGGFTQRSKR